MTNTQQLIAGMTISVDENIYKVESCVKVTVAKGTPFIKAKLKNLITDETIEKNFKVGQSIHEVALLEKTLEYLYLEGRDYLFLDIKELEQILISSLIIGDKVNFLKEGVHVKAKSYGDTIFSIELPQFLELMIVKTEPADTVSLMSNGTKSAILETGAKIEVPLFIEIGDIVKVDTQTSDFIQRV